MLEMGIDIRPDTTAERCSASAAEPGCETAKLVTPGCPRDVEAPTPIRSR